MFLPLHDEMQWHLLSSEINSSQLVFDSAYNLHTTVLLSSPSHQTQEYSTMHILSAGIGVQLNDAVPLEGLKGSQCWFSALPLTCRDFSRFSDSFDDGPYNLFTLAGSFYFFPLREEIKTAIEKG